MGGADISGRKVGPYLLTSIIGCGSAGNVYGAVDSTHDSQTLAIKCLPKTKISRRRCLQLVAEVVNHDIVSGCSHVLPLRDIVEEDLYLFLVLDMCEMDMFKAIWEEKVYWGNDALIRKAFIEVIDGVIACHDKGIFHRDLKPENLMCKADGTGIQIGDFGLATNHRICRDGGCGSPCYMSPECWTCGEGDPYFGGLTDVWSLGVILFNMVTTCYPWEAALPSDKEYSVFVNDEDHLFHTSSISDSLSELLKIILHPAPAKRLSIPRIRKAILEMDTFYKRRPSHPNDSLLSERRILADPDVNARDFLKWKKEHTMVAPSSVQKMISWTKLHYWSLTGRY